MYGTFNRVYRVLRLRPSKSYNFKIQGQEDNNVHLFEEMTNSGVPSE